MTNRQTTAFACLLSWLCLPGCEGDAEFTPARPFDETRHVQAWANSASAVGVYSNVFQVLAVADGHGAFADARCPAISDDGTTWSADGDCTDSDGTAWRGHARIVRDGSDCSLWLDAFQGNDGTLLRREVELDRHEFEAHLVLGSVTTIDYVGSVQGGYTGPTLWNGNGHVERQGAIMPTGAIDASTLDQTLDNDVCAGQAVSGRTTLKSGSDEAVISYDGESDCDDAQNAKLSVNGEDRGTISGISCAVVAPGSGGLHPGWASLAGVFCGAWLSLRRRRDRACRLA
jgi:hypothetical protein